MSDESDYSDIPTGQTARLKYSITNLWDDLGSADDPWIGLLISVVLALVGVYIYVAFTGWVSFAGGVWAVLNLIGPIKWVLGL